MSAEIPDKSEQQRCPSKNCKRAKFDPPKSDCLDTDFHWLMAGKKWELKDDGDYHQVDTNRTRRQSFDGLLSDTAPDPETGATGPASQRDELKVVPVRNEDGTMSIKWLVDGVIIKGTVRLTSS